MLNSEIRLVSLRIPTNWVMEFNAFYEIDPKNFVNKDYRYGDYFSEDLLQLSYKNQNVILDLGWYPSWDPNGKFRVVLVKDFDWEMPVISYESRDIKDVINKIEETLMLVGEGLL